jgi:hypothetical protein
MLKVDPNVYTVFTGRWTKAETARREIRNDGPVRNCEQIAANRRNGRNTWLSILCAAAPQNGRIPKPLKYLPLIEELSPARKARNSPQFIPGNRSLTTGRMVKRTGAHKQ